MPLPRKKDAGGAGAPVLNILSAHVKLFDVEEHTEPYTVSRKADGSQFTLDPGFKCTVEVIDDNLDGSDNGARFFETFKYKQHTPARCKLSPDKRRVEIEETGPPAWVNKENSKLGMLTNVVKPGYFDDDSIPEISEEDLEGFEMMCRIKPKKNPTNGAITGSTIDWETMRPLPTKAKAAAVVAEEDADFDDIPF
jgi:hypothetical protein